ERPGQVRSAPLARSGLHVKFEESVPHLFGEIAAGEPMHADAGGERILTFAPDGFAFSRTEHGEKIVEASIAGVFPVELLVGAPQITKLAEKGAFGFGGEGDVYAGGAGKTAQFRQAAAERPSNGFGVRSRPYQEATPGRRRERHRDLQLRVIAAARPLIGFGPA